jgi:hypothetical protein
MDDVLKRPLFKDKAMQVYKAKHGGKVPGFFVGQMVKTGLPYLSRGFGQVFGPTGKLARFQALNPKTAAAIEIGTGAPLFAEGMQDIYGGIKSGDYAQIAQGVGETALGVGGTGLGLKALTQASRKTPGFKQATYLTGKGVAERTLRPGVAIPALGATIYPTLAGGEEETTTEKPIEERLTYEQGAPDIREDIVPEQPEKRITGIKGAKTQAELTMNEDIKKANAINDVTARLGVFSPADLNAQTIKNIAAEANVTEADVKRLAGIKDEPTTATGQPIKPSASLQKDLTPDIGPNKEDIQNYNPAEVQASIALRNNQIKDSRLAGGLNKEFQAFKQDIGGLIGDNDSSIRDLLALKAAGKLMSTKTRQRGFRGFLDVGGQALQDISDSMLQLALKQKENDMELAKAFLKYKGEKAAGPEMLTTPDVTIAVPDNSAPGGVRNVNAVKGKDGKFYGRTVVNGKQTFAELPFTGTDVKYDSEKAVRYQQALLSNAEGAATAKFAQDLALIYGGPKGEIMQFSENFFGITDQFLNDPKYVSIVATSDTTLDDFIKAKLAKDKGDKDAAGNKLGTIDDYEKGKIQAVDNAKKEYQDYLKKQAKKRNVSVSSLRPDERELEIITKLAFAEHRMKYVLANANKGDTDRLAQRDIDSAAGQTAIMTFLKSPSTVSNNYKQIESTFNKKLGENIALLKSSGVTDAWILNNAGNVPGVQKIYEEATLKNKQRQTRQNIVEQPQAQTNILKTIPIR